MTAPPHTRLDLGRHLRDLGVSADDVVIVHAAMSRMGRLLGGPDIFVGALLDVVSPRGTVLAYTDWDGDYEDLLDEAGQIAPEWRAHVSPFRADVSRAVRDNGILPEFVRTTPGARRSANPGASVAAVGAMAEWITSDHPLDFGYGENSPFAKLVETGGSVLMVGAPLDTMTLLHHAEHLARIPNKRLRRYEAPLVVAGQVQWRMIEEYDTADPVVAGLDDAYFGTIVRDYLATGRGRQGLIGDAPSVLVDARSMCAFGVAWLERECGGGLPS